VAYHEVEDEALGTARMAVAHHFHAVGDRGGVDNEGMGFHHEVVAVGPVDAAPFPGEEVEDLQVVSPSYPEDGVDVPHEVQEAAAALADK